MRIKFKETLLSLSTVLLMASCSAADNTKITTEPATASNIWPNDNVAFCSAALDHAGEQFDGFRKTYTNPNKIPTQYENGKAAYTNFMGWTSGFVAGSFWYLYEHNQDESWLNTATQWTDALERSQFNRKTHDIGFIMNNSYGNGLRLTGNTAYDPILLNSAKTLMERYNPKLGLTFSWSWGSWEFPVIIDNMMNLELLFNASLATGDKTYYDAAVSHATVTMKHHFRDDFSSYHLVDYNRTTGLPKGKQTFQGIADDSSWSRGQAWGAYGYTMVYRYTKNTKFLEHAKGIVNYLLTHKNMPEDLVPYFDYDAPDYPEITNYRDSSAASLLASSLFELANYVEADEVKRYRDAAMTMLRSLSSPEYLAENGKNGHFLLKQATYNFPKDLGLNTAINYGDYYYLEALTRCKSL